MTVIGREGLRVIRPRSIDVEMPELGGAIRLRSLTSAEFGEMARLEFETRHMEGGEVYIKEIDTLVEIVAMAWIDNDGQQVVTDEAGRKYISQWPLEMLKRAGDAAGEISGKGVDAVKDAEKNSEATLNTDSGTG